MKLQKLLFGAAALLLPFTAAQEGTAELEDRETFNYRVSVVDSLHLPPHQTQILCGRRTRAGGLTGSTLGADTQSDISRLRSLVIHSLYSHKDVFLRELLSNANDALEKLRLEALTNRDVFSAGEPNITITVDMDEGGNSGRLIVRDTGIGMNKTELAKNLGTIARSGTNEFLARAEKTGKADTNLIGQFGGLQQDDKD